MGIPGESQFKIVFRAVVPGLGDGLVSRACGGEVMTLPITEAQVKRAQQIIRSVVDLQRELFDMGLPDTSAAMAAVNDRIGWEIAERMETSGLVGKEEHRRRERHTAFDERERKRHGR